MKKLIAILAVTVSMTACNNASTDAKTGADSVRVLLIL